MTNGGDTSPDTDNTPVEGSPFTPRQVRILKIAVIVMGLLLVGGFLLIIGTIAFQSSRMGLKKEVPATGVPPASPEEAFDVTVPQGAEIADLEVDGDRLVLHMKSSDGAEILVIDLKRGRVLSRIILQPE